MLGNVNLGKVVALEGLEPVPGVNGGSRTFGSRGRVYESFGLDERQLQFAQQSISKMDYYYQSRDGNQLLNWAWANWHRRSAP